MTPREAIRAAPGEACRPEPRRVLAPDIWAALPQDPALRLLALWADTVQAHALLLDTTDGAVLPVSVAVQDGAYPALSVDWGGISAPQAAQPVSAAPAPPAAPALQHAPTASAWPGAAWFERMVHDLWGHTAVGAHDLRPWLDHGRWPHTMPLASRPGPPVVSPEPPEFLADDTEGLMQLPLGPVRDAIGEPAHLRLTLRGDSVLRAEARLGYAHKGTLLLLRGKSPRAAARFIARLSADATVAHALAFAHAAEIATESPAPPRAVALRALMAELERIAGHLDALSVLADCLEAAAFGGACCLHRELLRRAAEVAFGHRLMMDWVVPGGIAADIAPGGVEAVRRALQRLRDALPELQALADALAVRLRGIGSVSPELAALYALGGVAGRAAGRRFDARALYPPYAALGFSTLAGSGGDAAGRLRQQLGEIADSLHLTTALLDDLPDGAMNVPLQPVSGEGVGCAESPRGDIWHWLRLDHGQIAAAFLRDPGWALWPVAEAVLLDSRVEEADLVRISFGLPSSGVDL